MRNESVTGDVRGGVNVSDPTFGGWARFGGSPAGLRVVVVPLRHVVENHVINRALLKSGKSFLPSWRSTNKAVWHWLCCKKDFLENLYICCMYSDNEFKLKNDKWGMFKWRMRQIPGRSIPRMRMFNSLVNIILTLPFGLHNRIRPLVRETGFCLRPGGGGGVGPTTTQPPTGTPGGPVGDPKHRSQKKCKKCHLLPATDGSQRDRNPTAECERWRTGNDWLHEFRGGGNHMRSAKMRNMRKNIREKGEGNSESVRKMQLSREMWESAYRKLS